jgi:hypothetical protein
LPGTPKIAGPSIEHRGDAVFALPAIPRTACAVGAPAGWIEDLQARGIEVVDGRADLAVAGPGRAAEAGRLAPAIVVDGARGLRRASRGGRSLRRLVSLPLRGSPAWIVPLDRGPALGHALGRFGADAGRAVRARNAVAARLLARGVLGRMVPAIVVGAPSSGPPALLAAAADLGVDPDARWAMVVAAGSPVRRNALLVFDAAGREPRLAIKFARVRGSTGPFEREARGLAVARAAGGRVSAVAPTELGRFEADGHHAAVQDAARGIDLTAILAGRGPLEGKIAALELVVGWLEQVARDTARPPEALAPLRDRLAAGALAHWLPPTLAADVASGVAAVPAVLRHGDLGDDNVVIGTSLTLLDWEWAQPAGLPLADLVYFGSRALRLLDDAAGVERHRYFADLMAGRAPSSARMFAWIRRLARAVDLPSDAVAPVVVLGLVEHAELGAAEREGADAATGIRHAPSLPERALRAWLDDPALGPRWQAWQRQR